MKTSIQFKCWLTTASSILCLSLLSQPAIGSSHREAPLTAEDQMADNTDVYAFVSPEDKKSDRAVLIANFIPFSKPENGPNFVYFAESVRYEIHVNNSGLPRADMTFRFDFAGRRTRNPNSFLFNTGPVNSIQDKNLNVTQTYRLTILRRGQEPEVRGPFPVAPDNVGIKSFPKYSEVRKEASRTAKLYGEEIRVYAGGSAEQFYVDVGAAFDLLSVNPAAGKNGTARTNVHTVAVEIPKHLLTRGFKNPTSEKAPESVIGVWATASRQAFRILDVPVREGAGGSGLFPGRRLTQSFGPFIQVSRLANPLVNELLIPLGSKDKFNGLTPWEDARFQKFIEDPEPARLLNGLFGLKVPPTPRKDLHQVFLTGIDGLNFHPIYEERNGQATSKIIPADMMRLNLAIPPTPKGSIKRLGVLAGDRGGYPNGRRIDDDVVDITLQAAAGVLVPGFQGAPNSDLSDGVDAPDAKTLDSFPFLPAMFAGN
jgi:hypothetical protein